MLLERLETVPSALHHAARLYKVGSDETRRSLNRAIFQPLKVDLVDEGGAPLAETAYAATCQARGLVRALLAAVIQLRARSGSRRFASRAGAKGPHRKPPASLRLPGVPT